MIVKQELINKIKDYFGLNIYETKVWLALLVKGVASAGEIASISGVPRSRTYDVLESLDKRGFAIVKLGKPVKYIGVKPHFVLEKLKNNIKKEAEDRIMSLSKIKETDEYLQLEQLYNEGINPVKREDITLALKGKSNITNHLKELLNSAEREVLICINADDLLSKQKLFRQTFDELKNRGVKVKVALSGNDKMVKHAGEKFKEKFKKINIDAKFFIIDRREILFYITKSASGDDIAIWLNSEFFANAFASMFDKALK